MAEIDSLEISIQSNIDKVNRNMDLLIQKMGTVARGISAIGSNKGLDEFIKSTKNASESMGNIGKKVDKSVKPIEGQMQKISKSFEQVGEPFKDLGKNFKVSGGIADIQKSIQKYENELEKAKLKEQELSAKGMTDTKGYRDAVANVIKYQNVIESLKTQLDEFSKTRFSYPEPEKFEIEDDITEHLRSVGAFAELKDYVEDVKNSLNQATEEMRAFSGAWNGIELPDFSDKEIVKLSIDEEKFSGTIEAFKEELKEIDSIIEGGGQEGEAGTLYPVARLQRALSNLKQMHPEAIDLISSYEEEMNRLNEVVAGGAQMQKIGKIDLTQFDQAKEKTRDFESALNSLRSIQPQINETNLTKLQNKLKAVEEQTEKLRYELEKGLRFGKISDKQFDSLTIKIQESENTAEALREKIAEVGNGGERQKVESLSSSFSKVSGASRALSKALSGVVNSMKKFAKGVVSVFSGIGRLAKSMLLLGGATKKSNGGFNLGLKTILKYGFGIRSLYVLVNKLRSAIKEGMKNLIQYSDQTNQSVSMLSSSMSQFKNASAAAFAPILNAIAPALNSLIQLFIRATNVINQFFAALTGQGTWIRAKYVYEDVADKISGAADAAKGALQPFDKLNNLTTQKSASGVDPSDMFETLPVEDKFKDLADWIKDMWDNADFYDLGRKIGEELQHALANIPWDKIKTAARKLGKSLATLINGFVEVEGLGKAIGYSISQAINTAYEFLNSFVHSLNWDSIGKFIAETINGFTQNIDWALIRDTLITGAKGLADAINAFVDYLDWDAVADTISNSINALADTIIMFFERTDWSELGHKVGYTLEKSIEDIDFDRVGRALADILQSALDFASGVIAELDWGEIKSAIKDLLTGFFGNITIPDNLKGIITALVGIEGAVISLKGVMGTAKLAKSFSEIWDAAKKIQKLKVPKIFTDIKGAFSPFSDAFKQFKNSFAISGDLFASFKNGFSSLSSGLEAFRASLSPVTKGVVGLTAVFAEFKIVGNAFDDIIKGTGNLSASIGKIVAASGAAATALSVVFGVPAGIIIAGVTAAVAGLKSLNDHFNELEVERVGERIRDSLSNPGGVSLDSIIDQYADSFAEMRGQFTNISDQATKVDMLDDSITNVYRDIDKIRTSMDNGVISVEEGTEKLRTLFEELETVTAEKFGAIEDTLYSAFGEGGAFRESFEAIGGNAQEVLAKVSGVSVEMQDRIREINELQMSLDPLSEEYQKLEDEKRAITGSLDSVTEAFNQFSTDINSLNVDYSKLFDGSMLTSQFDTTISALVESGKSYQGSIKDSTTELINRFTELANAARATGDEAAASYFEQQAKLAGEAGGDLQSQVGEQAKQITDKIQSDFIDAISQQITQAQADWDNLGTGEKLMMSITKDIDTQDEYVKSQIDAFKTNTLDPMSQQIDDALTQLGVDGAGWASDATQQIVDSLFDTTVIAKGTYVDVDSVLANDWTSILDSVKENVKPKATEAGQYIGQGIGEGMSSVDLSADSQKMFDIILSGFNIAAGIASPAKNMIPSGQYITLGILEGFKSKFDAFTAPIQQLCNSITSKIANGLQNMKNTWSNIWNSLPNVVTGVINRITSSLSTLVSNIANAFSNITSRIRSVGSSFSGIRMPSVSKQSAQRIKGYKAGGFPEDGLFYKNNDEMITQVAGKTQVLNSTDTFDMIRQAAYAGFMQAMSNSGGMGVNVTFQVEGDPNGLFNVIQKEVQTKAKRQGSAPPAVFA